MTPERFSSELKRIGLEFNARFDIPVRERPTGALPQKDVSRILGKLREEVQEIWEAVEREDVVGIADGIADACVVLSGMAAEYGLDLDVLLRVVHESNMTKDLQEGVPFKGKHFRRPKIEAAIASM